MNISAKLEEKIVSSDIYLSKLTASQKAFYDDLVALQKACHPTDDSEVTTHDIVWNTMEKVFPRLSHQHLMDTHPQQNLTVVRPVPSNWKSNTDGRIH